MRNRNKIAALLFAGILAFITAGCITDHIEDESRPGNGGKSSEQITFVVEVPGNRLPSTRGMADGDGEETVSQVDILVFDRSVSPEVLIERVQGTDITQSGNSSDKYKVEFRAKLTVRSTASRLVIVTNASDQVDDMITAIGADKSKKNVMEKLVYSSSNPGGTPEGWKWATDGPAKGSYTPVPMYAEIEIAEVKTGMRLNNIGLVRMLARIDVKNNATGRFTLETIYLANYNTAGFIAPAWDTANGKLLATAPSSPYVPGLAGMPGSANNQSGDNKAVPYTYVHSVNGFQGEIYTYESIAPVDGNANDAARKNATCLILKGRLSGDNTDYYYRVDFTEYVDPDTGAVDPENIAYMPLRRNHKYAVNILAATGPGYTSIDDALKSYTVVSNLKTRIISYDQGTIKDIVYNGQYMLGVEQAEYEIYREKHEADVKVFTDNPNGWIATIPAHTGNWLKLAGGVTTVTGAAGDNSAALSFVAEANATGASRTAVIKLSADRLNHEIKVTQTDRTGMWIRITDEAGNEINRLDIGGEIFDGERFFVSWGGPDDCRITESPGFGGAGELGFSSWGDDPVAIGTITGGTHSFKVIPLPVRMDSDIADMEKVKTNELTFTITDDLGNDFSRTLVVSKSPTDKEPNSYMVVPGVTVNIPVRNAFGVWPSELVGQDLTTGVSEADFGAELIWQDAPGLVTSVNYVQGSGIRVTTSAAQEGNAVVAFTIGSGADRIKWSYHVWVTSYRPDLIPASDVNGFYPSPTPETRGGVYRHNTTRYANPGDKNNIFMDRNLGAAGILLNADQSISHDNAGSRLATFGLLYQWGRKDPFPGASSSALNTNTEKQIWGGMVNRITNTPVAAAKNLVNAITNPATFYGGLDNLTIYDWYTATNDPEAQNNRLWEDNGKTIFDPCPAGWRVPVSGGTMGSSRNSAWYNGNATGAAPSDYSHSNASVEEGYEINRTSNMGWHPNTGRKNCDTGNFSDVGAEGYLWSASVYDNNTSGLFCLQSNAVQASASGSRSSGLPVRCVKEDNTSQRNTINEGYSQAGSNSYMMWPNPQGEVWIPVMRAWGVWQDPDWLHSEAQNLSGAVTAEVMWRDVADPNFVTATLLGDQGPNSFIRVTTNGLSEGNAIVVVRVGGVVRWSWHIWIVNYAPNFAPGAVVPNPNPREIATNNGPNDVIGGHIYRRNNGDTQGGEEYVFMDRYLGAVLSGPTPANDAGKVGLMYQWGRKDPTPSAEQLLPTRVDPDDEIGECITSTRGVFPARSFDWHANTTASVANTIIYPDRLYDDLIHDNYRNSWDTNGGIGGQKGVMDPCPPGWRVPAFSSYSDVGSPWNGFVRGLNIENPLFDTANHGIDTDNAKSPDNIGWWSVTGRQEKDGNYYWVGDNLTVWSATPSTNSEEVFIFHACFKSHLGTMSSVFYPMNQAKMVVRCVAE